MKVYLDSVGCRLNQSEIELFANQFRGAGHVLVAGPADADLVVVNTCVVTTQAASDSRQKARQAARAGAKNIVLTGCWATVDKQTALSLPNVSSVITNDRKDFLVPEILQQPVEKFDLEPLEREPLPGLHLRTRAFIKIQDGCDNHCTFCITKIARGPARSRAIKSILADINAAIQGGGQEIVLTGVQSGSWGQDFSPEMNISQLLEIILNETKVQRLRLSSLEPWNLESDFFELWKDSRLCRHLHLPLQSGSASVLKRMARKTSPAKFANLVDLARQVVPEIAITTDIIVGFPGEDDDDFSESLAFVEKIQFAGGHVFSYSERPGTAASRFTGVVPMMVRKQRNKRMQSLLRHSSEEYRRLFIGQKVKVLWEATTQRTQEGWLLSGLTDNYLRIYALAGEPLWNKISPVEVSGLREDGLYGKIISAQTSQGECSSRISPLMGS